MKDQTKTETKRVVLRLLFSWNSQIVSLECAVFEMLNTVDGITVCSKMGGQDCTLTHPRARYPDHGKPRSLKEKNTQESRFQTLY
jgi:hypothetical protein